MTAPPRWWKSGSVKAYPIESMKMSGMKRQTASHPISTEPADCPSIVNRGYLHDSA